MGSGAFRSPKKVGHLALRSDSGLTEMASDISLCSSAISSVLFPHCPSDRLQGSQINHPQIKRLPAEITSLPSPYEQRVGGDGAAQLDSSIVDSAQEKLTGSQARFTRSTDGRGTDWSSAKTSTHHRCGSV